MAEENNYFKKLYSNKELEVVKYLRDVDIDVNSRWAGFEDSYGNILRRMESNLPLTADDVFLLKEDADLMRQDLHVYGTIDEKEERLYVLETMLNKDIQEKNRKIFVLKHDNNGELITFEEEKEALLYDIDIAVGELRSDLRSAKNYSEQENAKNGIEWYQEKRREIESLKETQAGFESLYRYIHYDREFNEDIFMFDDAVRVDDKIYGISCVQNANFGEPDFRAKIYNVYDFVSKETVPYFFYEQYSDNTSLKNIKWQKKDIYQETLDSWNSVNLNDKNEKKLCDTILAADNRLFANELRIKSEQLLKDNGEKIIEREFPKEVYSIKGFCGLTIQLILDDINKNSSNADLLDSIENEIKPIMGIVHKVDAGKKLAFDDLVTLDERVAFHNNAILSYKGIDFAELTENTFDKVSSPKVSKPKKLELKLLSELKEPQKTSNNLLVDKKSNDSR